MKRREPYDLRTTLSRRRLLGGLGALTVSLASPIWRTATAFGKDESTPAPRRFLGIFSANGTVAREFFPTDTASEAPLTLGAILAPLAAQRDKLVVLKGVHMNSTVEDELGVPGANKPGGPHMKGPGAMLTGGSLLAGSFTGSGGPAGWADRISLDQELASRLGQDTRFASLEFGVRVEGQEPLRVISYRGANRPNLTVDDPWQMYERIFADAELSAAELARLRMEQKSVLDFLKDDLARLRARMGSDDRARLEAHLGGIRSIEQRLAHAATSCSPLTLPERVDARAMENYPRVGRLQTDLMVLAHACDLTRVSTFMWANADSWQYYPWIGVDEEHHELSHAGDDDIVANDKLVKINAWHAEQVAYVLDQLANTQSAEGKSLLDDTVLLWGNELGAGNTHTYKDIPWLLATGSKAFATGRYLRYDGDGQPHNNMLLSLCHAMGLTDLKSFGIPGVCTGLLPGLL
jgi:hypothetical protein